MTTIIVWLLISVSTSFTGGTATTIERFPTAGDCEWVRSQLPMRNQGIVDTKCIKAKIVTGK